MGTAAGPSTLQMPANDAQETIVDEPKQNVDMLKDKINQQLLMLGNGPAGIVQRPTQHGATTDRKEAQQFAALRPTASSVVAAAHDPYKTPPQKKEDYGHEQ